MICAALKCPLATTEELTPRVPADRIVVGESGIASHADIVRLTNAGVRTFLVGGEPDAATGRDCCYSITSFRLNLPIVSRLQLFDDNLSLNLGVSYCLPAFSAVTLADFTRPSTVLRDEFDFDG